MKDSQQWFRFPGSGLKVTREYYRKYEAISEILDAVPRLLDLVHQDIESVLASDDRATRNGPPCRFTSEQVLRVLVSQGVEGLSLREIVIRVDDSSTLREFTKIHGGPMMDYTTLCRFRSAISEQTWKKINDTLTRHVVDEGLVTGERLRVDTTAVETNIHWPNDSGLLWDTYRVLARLIESAREIDRGAVGEERRLRARDMKRQHTLIGRLGRKGRTADRARKHYKLLIEGVRGILAWSGEVAARLEQGSSRHSSLLVSCQREHVAAEIRKYMALGERVVWQASQRVLEGRKVPADQKLFSIFEPHTEMLVRGKASRNVEFGHMIGIEQVEGKFISHYEVFAKKPNEHCLLPEVVERHKKIFGSYPEELAADKGYWPGTEELPKLESKVRLVSVGKMGSRNEEETDREHDPEYREAQKFRAGVEGTIAFLKRILGLTRCLRKGWLHFVCNVGATIFAHNLLILARC